MAYWRLGDWSPRGLGFRAWASPISNRESSKVSRQKTDLVGCVFFKETLPNRGWRMDRQTSERRLTILVVMGRGAQGQMQGSSRGHFESGVSHT